MTYEFNESDLEELRTEAAASLKRRTTGLFRKYEVTRTDGKPVNWCFVLEDKDPLAVPALTAYAEAAGKAGYVALAQDLAEKVRELMRTASEDQGEG